MIPGLGHGKAYPVRPKGKKNGRNILAVSRYYGRCYGRKIYSRTLPAIYQQFLQCFLILLSFCHDGGFPTSTLIVAY